MFGVVLGTLAKMNGAIKSGEGNRSSLGEVKESPSETDDSLSPTSPESFF